MDAMSFETPGKRIQFIRTQILGMKHRPPFAQALGVSTAAVGQWERDVEKIGLDKLLAISKLSGVSVDWIVKGDGQPPIFDAEKIEHGLIAEEIDRKISTLSKTTVDRDGYTLNVPDRGIREIDSSAGLGGGQLVSDAYELNDDGYEIVDAFKQEPWILPRSFLDRSFRAKASQIIAITTQGESMAPTINHGDVVFIDTTHTRISPPGLYAMRDVYGEVIVKRLDVFKNNGAYIVRITSDNHHEPTRDEPISEIHIVGRICGIMKAV